MPLCLFLGKGRASVYGQSFFFCHIERSRNVTKKGTPTMSSALTRSTTKTNTKNNYRIVLSQLVFHADTLNIYIPIQSFVVYRTFVYLCDVVKSASLLSLHRPGGLHRLMSSSQSDFVYQAVLQNSGTIYHFK